MIPDPPEVPASYYNSDMAYGWECGWVAGWQACLNGKAVNPTCYECGEPILDRRRLAEASNDEPGEMGT